MEGQVRRDRTCPSIGNSATYAGTSTVTSTASPWARDDLAVAPLRRGASVRSVQSPGAAKNRNCPVADVGTSAVNSPERVEQPHVRAGDRLAVAGRRCPG